MNQHGGGRADTTWLSMVRVATVYLIVLWFHNLAPLGARWHWFAGVNLQALDPVMPLSACISDITMPLMFFVSGCVLKISGGLRRSFGDFMMRKIQRIAIPGIVFGVLLQLLIERRVTPEGFLGYWHLWYLRHLFLFFLVARLLITRRTERLAPLVVAAVCLVVMIASEVVDGLPHFMCGHLMYFMLGYAAASYTPRHWLLVGPCADTTRRLVVVVAAVSFVSMVAFRYVGIDRFGFLFMLLMLPGVLIVLHDIGSRAGVVRLTRRLAPTSYGVYIFHVIWLYVLYSGMAAVGAGPWLAANIWWASTLLAVASLLLSLATTPAVRRFARLKI